jgi:hypothetical protein
VSAILVHLAVEGRLDEEVLRKAIEQSRRPYQVMGCYGKKGKGDLNAKLPNFNRAARVSPWIVLRDLDQDAECAPILVRRLLPHPHPNLLLRVAVREVESWLLADAVNLSKFLGVGQSRIAMHPDEIRNPKQELISIARGSQQREIQKAIVPRPGWSSKIGKDYNGKLIEFVLKHWDVHKARKKSPSLNKAMIALEKFRPAGLSKNQAKEDT